MIVCIKCKKEMPAVKNGVQLHYGHGHCYASDMFECPSCHCQIANANNQAWQSKQWEGKEESDVWIEMHKGNNEKGESENE